MFNNNFSFKKVLTNVSLLLLGGISSAAFILLTQIILARQLSPVGFGSFSAALASITLLAPLAAFGVRHSWLKLYGAEGINANRWLSVSLKFILISFTLTVILILTWAFVGPHSSAFRMALIGLLPLVLSHIFLELLNARFQLEENYRALAIWQLLPHLLRLLFVIIFINFVFAIPNIHYVVAGYSCIAIFVCLSGYFYLVNMFKGKLLIKHDSKQVKNNFLRSKLGILDIANHSWPFGLAAIFYLIYLQSDLIILKYLVNDRAAGIYSAAFAVIISSYLIPGVIYQKFLLPKIHRWANQDQNKLKKVFQGGNGIMFFTGILILIVLYILIPEIVPLFFGPAYLETVLVLQILIFCVPIRFLATSIESPLFTKDLMPLNTLIWGLTAFLNLSLNFILIPSYSIYGAAAATLISEVFFLALNLIAVSKRLFGIETFFGWGSGFRKSFWIDI